MEGPASSASDRHLIVNLRVGAGHFAEQSKDGVSRREHSLGTPFDPSAPLGIES